MTDDPFRFALLGPNDDAAIGPRTEAQLGMGPDVVGEGVPDVALLHVRHGEQRQHKVLRRHHGTAHALDT